MLNPDPLSVAPVNVIPTPVLLDELRRRFSAYGFIGVLANEQTAALNGAHVAYLHGPSAQCIGLFQLGLDYSRNKFRLSDQPVTPEQLYGTKP